MSENSRDRNFPTTEGAFQRELRGEGGRGRTTITWASPNRLLVSSSPTSASFPVSDRAVGKKTKGERDAFFSVFDSADMTLRYSTLLGGNQLDTISKAYFLGQDLVVLGGITNSADFPLTENALDSVYPSADKLFNSSFLGRRKAFVSIVDIKKGELVYSTCFGACLRFELSVDKAGNLGFIAETGPQGFSGTTDFPLSEDAFQPPPIFLMTGRLNQLSLPGGLPEPPRPPRGRPVTPRRRRA